MPPIIQAWFRPIKTGLAFPLGPIHAERGQVADQSPDRIKTSRCGQKFARSVIVPAPSDNRDPVCSTCWNLVVAK